MPISFQITITPDLNPILDRFKDANKGMLDAFSAGLKQSGAELRDRLAAASPRGKSSHAGPKIASSWVLQEGYLDFAVRNTAPQLVYVLKGNDAGDGYIYAKNGGVLAFDIGGEMIFARRVKATPANDFVTPVRQAWQVKHKAIMQTSLKATVSWLARGS